MDFLLGTSALLIALAFLFQFLPGAIIPFRSIADQNALLASSLGSRLAKEDPLADPLSWELFFMPNHLNRSRLESWTQNITQLKIYLGLHDARSGLDVSHLNLSLHYPNWSTFPEISRGEPLIPGTELGSIAVLVNLSGNLRLLQASIW